MNKKGIKILGAIAFLAALNTGLFLLAEDLSTASFWISWVFIHLAFAVFVGITVFSVAEQKRILSAYSEAAIATYYLVVELVVGTVFVLQSDFLAIIAFILQLVIMAVFICLLYSTKGMNKQIERKEEVRAVELNKYKYLLEVFKDVMRKVPYEAPYKKTVEHAYDAMMGSQMHSNEAVQENEANILSLVQQLKQAVTSNDEAEVKNICIKIEDEIAERNSKLRLG